MYCKNHTIEKKNWKKINANLFYSLQSELVRVEKERLEIEKKRLKIENDRLDIEKEKLAELRNITGILKQLRTPASNSFNSMQVDSQDYSYVYASLS